MTELTGIIDYRAGNIKSVERACAAIGARYVISRDPRELQKATRLIFPGVGDAAYAMQELKKSGFDRFLRDSAASLCCSYFSVSLTDYLKYFTPDSKIFRSCSP